MREYIERLIALQTIDLRIQEMEREKRQIPQFITSLEEELKKGEESSAGRRLNWKSCRRTAGRKKKTWKKRSTGLRRPRRGSLRSKPTKNTRPC